MTGISETTHKKQAGIANMPLPRVGINSSSHASASRYRNCDIQSAQKKIDTTNTQQVEFVDYLTPMMSFAYRLARQLTNHQADAEEIVQEAALLAFSHFDSFQTGTSFKSWFGKIVINCFLMSVRAQKSRPNCVDFTDITDEYIHQHGASVNGCDESRDPELICIHRFDSEQITTALMHLPMAYRVVCALYLVEEYSYQEIADQLDVSIGTVRSRLHRGRKLLQQCLLPMMQDSLRCQLPRRVDA